MAAPAFMQRIRRHYISPAAFFFADAAVERQSLYVQHSRHLSRRDEIFLSEPPERFHAFSPVNAACPLRPPERPPRCRVILPFHLPAAIIAACLFSLFRFSMLTNISSFEAFAQLREFTRWRAHPPFFSYLR